MKWRLTLILGLLLARFLTAPIPANSEAGPGLVVPEQIVRWRAHLAKIATRNLPEPESALVLGVVLGYKSALTDDFYKALVDSGTLHMVVASGYNVMVVAGIALSGFLFFLRRRRATLLAIVVLLFYVLLTGGEVSIIRATVMGSIVLFAKTIGRGSKGWWSLMFALWAMIMIEPSVVESISFQLSAAATFGVIILAPHIDRRVTESNSASSGLISKVDLPTTVGALLATWPVIWFHFGRGSLISLVSNSLILPLVPILMAFGAALLAAGLIFAPLAVMLSWPTYAVAHLVVILVNWFGGL